MADTAIRHSLNLRHQEGTMYQWPTRDEWAKTQRTVHFGDDIPSKDLHRYDHLVPNELRTSAHAELRALWRALAPHVRGYRQNEQAGNAHDLRDQITETLRRDTLYASDGAPVIPEHPDGFVLHRYSDALAHLPTVQAAHPLTAWRAYEAALQARHDAAYADYCRAVAARPIDDAAWDDELTRRARVDASLARFS